MLPRLLLAAALAAAQQERAYDMHIPGCRPQRYTLTEMNAVIAAQRAVWEDLGASVPWWSVLSAAEYDAQRELGDAQATEFYASGEKHVTAALMEVAMAVERAGGDAGQLPWGGGGFGGSAADFGCGVAARVVFSPARVDACSPRRAPREATSHRSAACRRPSRAASGP